MALHLAATIAAFGGIFCSTASAAPEQKIKHVIVLMEENRPFDHLFGWSGDLLGVEGLNGNEFNYLDPTNPDTSEKVFVDNKAPFTNDCDPAHGTTATTSKLFSTGNPETSVADMGGFVGYESKKTNYCNVMSGFPPERVPVVTALAQEYAIMDRFFASQPGPTWPNRMFALTGTSAGSTETSVWYHNIPGKLYPQRTIYDQIEEMAGTWKNYYNDTPWELILEKVAHNPANIQPMDAFYHDAATGNLPSFAWINPRSGINVTTGVGSNDQHPDHDVSAGEQYQKDVYEAIRASPQWNETLLVLTWDEHGGFYDHVIPPSENVPEPGDGEPSYPEVGFRFNRLGVRIPCILISPWIPKGTVISAPPEDKVSKPYPNSEFDLTSIIATTRKLLYPHSDLAPLTDRDAWSATFEYLFDELDQPREDCPLHMPDALEPEVPADGRSKPLNDLQVDIAAAHTTLTGNKFIPTSEGEGGGVPTQEGHAMWLQQQYALHAARTTSWRDSKLTHAPKSTVLSSTSSISSSNKQTEEPQRYQVVCQPLAWYGESPVSETKWHFNGLAHGEDGAYNTSVTPYITVSTWNLRTEAAPPALLPVGLHAVHDGDDDTVPLCLDAGEGTEGSVLQVSACYPSEDPSLNRDPFQQFRLHGDGSLRFHPPAAATGVGYQYRARRQRHLRSLLGSDSAAAAADGDADEGLCVTNHDPQIEKTGAATDVSVAFAATDGRYVPVASHLHDKYDLTLTLQKCASLGDGWVGRTEQNWAYHGVAPGEGGDGHLEFGDIEYYLGVVGV